MSVDLATIIKKGNLKFSMRADSVILTMHSLLASLCIRIYFISRKNGAGYCFLKRVTMPEKLRLIFSRKLSTAQNLFRSTNKTGYQLLYEISSTVRNMAPSRLKKLLLLIVHFFLNAVVANNDDIKGKLDALVHSLDRLSAVIDAKCKCQTS